MGWKDTAYQKGRRKVTKAVKKETKRFVKRNKGFVAGLIVCLILGLGLGIGANILLTKDDAFNLYENNALYNGEKITLQSGETYELESIENSVQVVSFGKDLTKYVTVSIKYLETPDSELQELTTTTFNNDGTYYVVYELNYDEDDFLTSLLASKYEKVKLRKTVVIGGENNE